MKRIRLIIFDLDGTLVDAYPAITESFNYVMEKFGLKKRSAKAVRGLVGFGDANLIRPHVPRKELAFALGLYRAHHQKSLVRLAKLYPQVKTMLRYFKKQGIKLAVASNRPSRFSHILLKHLKIRSLFDCILCADLVGHGKPHPEMLNLIVKQLGVDKAQTLYVGDMAIDAQAGRRAKIKTVIVTGGSSSKAQIKSERPFRVIPKISSLKRLLNGDNS